MGERGGDTLELSAFGACCLPLFATRQKGLRRQANFIIV